MESLPESWCNFNCLSISIIVSHIYNIVCVLVILMSSFFPCDKDIRVRLVGGPTSKSGRVEISFDGNQWGTVCDNDWGTSEARWVKQDWYIKLCGEWLGQSMIFVYQLINNIFHGLQKKQQLKIKLMMTFWRKTEAPNGYSYWSKRSV